MVLQQVSGIDDGHGNHGDFCLGRHFKTAGMERQQGPFFMVTGPFRENEHIDSRFFIFDGL